jgi:hypothetical protein
MAYMHSKEHRASIKKRELQRLLDAYAASIPRIDEPPTRFEKRRTVSDDLPATKVRDAAADTAKCSGLIKDYMKRGMSFDAAATKAVAEVYGGAAGTDQLIYGPNWRPAAWGDDASPPVGRGPATDGTMAASPNDGVMSHSAADGSPPAASSAYVGKYDNLVTVANIQDLVKRYPELRGDIVRAASVLRNGGN